MVPDLTSGSIKQMLSGEDVAEAVVQILCCKRLPNAQHERYQLLMSDGEYECSLIYLKSHLNSLATSGKLEKFTIIQVHKYAYSKGIYEQKENVIFLINLTVLASGSEVGRKIGNPVSISPIVRAVPTSDAVNNTEDLHISLMTEEKIRIPSMTSGSIRRILNGEDVSDAVLQILQCWKVLESPDDCYRLCITDGVTISCMVILHSTLNNLVTSKQIEKFSIVKIHKYYFCIEFQPEERCIILFDLTILTPGSKVGRKIRAPVASLYSLGTATSDGAKTLNNKPCETKLTMKEIVVPSMTSGSIHRILNGEDVSDAVLQILKFSKILESPNHWYRLSVSDGITSSSMVILHRKFNNLLTSKQLEKFSVIKIHNYAFVSKSPSERQFIILLDLTILTPGSKVGIKIDAPVASLYSLGTATSDDAKTLNNKPCQTKLTMKKITWQ